MVKLIKNIPIDWEKYKGMIIIQTNGQLVIEKLIKLKIKALFYKISDIYV